MTEKRPYEHDFEIETEPEERGERRPPKQGRGFLEFVVILLVAFVLVFGFIKPFVVQAFWIPSESMVPTLEVGDRVFINKFIYRFAEPQRGDVVVFESVEDGDTELIKRVVGLPGDEVAVRDGSLLVNEERWEESYVNKRLPDQSSYGPETVPEGHVFAMGDNRGNSRDSRFFGAVPIENIEGEAFMTFWPPDRVGLF